MNSDPNHLPVRGVHKCSCLCRVNKAKDSRPNCQSDALQPGLTPGRMYVDQIVPPVHHASNQVMSNPGSPMLSNRLQSIQSPASPRPVPKTSTSSPTLVPFQSVHSAYLSYQNLFHYLFFLFLSSKHLTSQPLTSSCFHHSFCFCSSCQHVQTGCNGNTSSYLDQPDMPEFHACGFHTYRNAPFDPLQWPPLAILHQCEKFPPVHFATHALS